MPLTSDAWAFENKGASKDTNPNYLCTITCTDQNIQLVASLPQEYTTDITADYQPIFAQLLENNIAGGAINIARAMGVQLTTQALTAKMWQGSSDITFTLPLVFQAINDEYVDVLDKLEALYQLTVPDELFANGFLVAPGPRIDPELVKRNLGDIVTQVGQDAEAFLRSSSDSAASSRSVQRNSSRDNGARRPLISSIKNNISLQIGNYQYYESVVITNINQNHSVQPLDSGVMSHVAVNVTFSTFVTPVKADIARIFRNSNSRSE